MLRRHPALIAFVICACLLAVILIATWPSSKERDCLQRVHDANAESGADISPDICKELK